MLSDHMLTIVASVFQLAFDHFLTGCITVFFLSVVVWPASCVILSFVTLIFYQLYRCDGFSKGRALVSYMSCQYLKPPRGVLPRPSRGQPNFVRHPPFENSGYGPAEPWLRLKCTSKYMYSFCGPQFASNVLWMLYILWVYTNDPLQKAWSIYKISIIITLYTINLQIDSIQSTLKHGSQFYIGFLQQLLARNRSGLRSGVWSLTTR